MNKQNSYDEESDLWSNGVAHFMQSFARQGLGVLWTSIDQPDVGVLAASGDDDLIQTIPGLSGGTCS